MPATSECRSVPGRPPARPCSGPRESPPHGGGVMGERQAGTGGRHARPHMRLPVPPPPPHTHHHARRTLGHPSVRSAAVVATDLVIENDRPPNAGLPHPPPLTPLCPPSTAIVLHTDPLENDDQQATSCAFFSFSRD